MCNIAGYVGRRDAAPILMDMMRRESGYGGGFYSGLAVMDEGMIYSEKVLGDMDRLTEAVRGRSMPGHVGIIHSRSNSGGDREWAHPFISNDGRLAYVANGSNGIFAKWPGFRADEVAQELERRGVRYASRAEALPQYPRLSDGSGVHCSEVMCHLIACHIEDGLEPEDAMRRAFCDFPAEIVGLALHTTVPDAILAARFNQPMMLGRAEDGVYLATTALAFPEDVELYALDLLPAGCSATIRADGWTIHGFRSPIPVATLDASLYRSAQTGILRYINASPEPVSIGKCCELTRRLWPQGMLGQSAVLCYEALRPLVRSGRVRVVHQTVPGAPEGGGGVMSTAYLFAKA